mmetsp:Transcript_19344/g.48660  ORF Transcript_19344/g.48660 Transcript_19344/m.48660 type:complete len:227 (-) Transcript_19344:371-1051(-)
MDNRHAPQLAQVLDRLDGVHEDDGLAVVRQGLQHPRARLLEQPGAEDVVQRPLIGREAASRQLLLPSGWERHDDLEDAHPRDVARVHQLLEAQHHALAGEALLQRLDFGHALDDALAVEAARRAEERAPLGHALQAIPVCLARHVLTLVHEREREAAAHQMLVQLVHPDGPVRHVLLVLFGEVGEACDHHARTHSEAHALLGFGARADGQVAPRELRHLQQLRHPL